MYCEFVCNLAGTRGFRTVQAFTPSTAKKYLQHSADGGQSWFPDLRLPDGNGYHLLRWTRKEGMMQPFIIMTETYAEVHTAVEYA